MQSASAARSHTTSTSTESNVLDAIYESGDEWSDADGDSFDDLFWSGDGVDEDEPRVVTPVSLFHQYGAFCALNATRQPCCRSSSER